jgi:chemotaxis methyl-accepting protein methylase
LIDLFGPQSYQPFAVADALLGLKLADVSRLQIHCVDINERVIAHLQNLRRRKEVSLSLLSGIKDSALHPLTDGYKAYFREFGRSIGVSSTLNASKMPSQFAEHLRKSLRVSPEVVNAISAGRLNIITERYEESSRYDLVVVTNVFPYFSPPELLFALTNISAMLVDGGYLIHNELKTVSTEFVTPLGLPLLQSGTVMIATSAEAPLFDGLAIHQKVHR